MSDQTTNLTPLQEGGEERKDAEKEEKPSPQIPPKPKTPPSTTDADKLKAEAALKSAGTKKSAVKPIEKTEDTILIQGKLETDEEIFVAHVELMDQLSYDGFNAAVIRESISSACEGKRTLIMKVLITYIECGNKFINRLKSVTDLTAGKDITKLLRTLGITDTITGKATLTLARIAQSMPLAIIRLRSMMLANGKLPSVSVACKAKPVFCDLALSSMSNSYPEIVDYLEKMSVELNKFAKKEKLPNAVETDAEAIANMHKFRGLATQNLPNDPVVRKYGDNATQTPMAAVLFTYGFTKA